MTVRLHLALNEADHAALSRLIGTDSLATQRQIEEWGILTLRDLITASGNPVRYVNRVCPKCGRVSGARVPAALNAAPGPSLKPSPPGGGPGSAYESWLEQYERESRTPLGDEAPRMAGEFHIL